MNSESGGAIRYGTGQNDTVKPHYSIFFGSDVRSFLVTTVIFFVLAKLCSDNFMIRKRKGDRHSDKVTGLELIPGPTPFPIKLIGNIHQLHPMRDILQNFSRMIEKYGSCFKFVGLNRVGLLVADASVTEAVLKSPNLHHVNKNIVYDVMKPFITNGILVSKGKFWQTQRKILMRSMSFQSLRAYITMLNTHSQRLVHLLEKRFSDGKVHAINELISSSFLDIICEMITGFDMYNTDEGVQYHHNFQIWKESVAYRLMHPWLVANILWKLHPLSWKTNRAVNDLFKFARRRISEHKEKRKGSIVGNQLHGKSLTSEQTETISQYDKTSKFRSVLDELVDAGVSQDQIVDEVNTMLFGGHETGASTMHFFCFCMALHPEIQEVCRNEVDELFNDPMLVVNGKMNYESCSNSSLKYLERCFMETLRLYPPVIYFLRDLAAPLRVELKGKPVELPVGTNVALAPFFIHRNPEYFPNPAKFDPDRFLPEECAKRHAYSFIPFSNGMRNCLGLKFAMIEMKMIAAYLLRNFEISTPDKEEDITLLSSLTLTPDRDMRFLFKKRNITEGQS